MFIPSNLISKIELNTVLEEFRKYSVLSVTADLFDTRIFNSEKQYELRSMEINRYLRTGTSIGLRQFYLDNLFGHIVLENLLHCGAESALLNDRATNYKSGPDNISLKDSIFYFSISLFYL